MTVGDDVVRHLFGEDGGVARLLKQVLNQVLQAQETLQTAPHERTAEGRGYRNGTVDPPLTPRVGALTLRVLRLRDGSFSPQRCGRSQRHEQAFVQALLERVIHGGSTRKVTTMAEERCGTEISKPAVSTLCQQLDPVVTACGPGPGRTPRIPSCWWMSWSFGSGKTGAGGLRRDGR